MDCRWRDAALALRKGLVSPKEFVAGFDYETARDLATAALHRATEAYREEKEWNAEHDHPLKPFCRECGAPAGYEHYPLCKARIRLAMVYAHHATPERFWAQEVLTSAEAAGVVARGPEGYYFVEEQSNVQG